MLCSFFLSPSPIQESFLPLIPMLKSMIMHKESSAEDGREGKTPQTLSSEEKEILQLLVKRFTQAVAPAIDKTTDALDALLLALQCPVSLGALTIGNTVQMLMLEQVCYLIFKYRFVFFQIL